MKFPFALPRLRRKPARVDPPSSPPIETPPTVPSAAPGPTPLERLAARPDARILSVGPVPPEAAPGLKRSVLWNRLEPVAQGRFGVMSPVNPFGAVPAALRFARLAADALERMA